MKNFISTTTRRAPSGGSNDQSVRPQDTALGNRRQREMVYLAILVLLCLVLFFLFLGNRPLWDVDEGMHAATSKDMILSGDWITPQLNGENFYDKPVLFNWLVAISLLVFGFTEFAARLPAAVLGTGSVLVTYFLGRRLFSPTVGFLGGVILATGVEFIILSRVVVHDIALTLFVTLALTFFYRGFTDTSGRKSVWLLFYAALGLAVLAKGPIGVLLPGLIIFLFLVIKRRLNIIRDMQLGWGILIFLAVAAPWYVLIMLKNNDYAGYFFIQQNLAYFFSGESRHPRPFYYYFPTLMGGFFPWSLFLPAALFRALRRGFGQTEDGTLFLMLWFGAVFLFFSTASSKLSTYILPLFPAVSLLTAALW
ncbi:MAG: glycosyltransferase family 39 protein, partial [Desulfobacterales bacterium]